jgi:transcriptional regulator with XRE-family HTH domain
VSDTSSKIPGRLRLAREQAGLSQGQIAKLMGMHRPTISEIEAGRRRVQADELAAFARHYRVAVRWLLGQDDEEDDLHAAKVRLAARQLARLKSDDLDLVMNLLSSLRDDASTGGRKR